MRRPTAIPASLLGGLRLPVEAAGLLWRERSLWGPAAVPVGLSLAAFSGALALIVTQAGPLHALATDWMPSLEAARWYAWLWVGPARLLLGVLGGVLFVLLAALCLVVAYVLASLLAAPFHDVLAARVERLVTGGVDDRSGSGGVLADAWRSLREELRRVAFLAALMLPLALAGLVVPGAQLVCGPALLALGVFFLPLDYSSYTLDRRRVTFRDKRRWLLAHAPVTAGFGLAAFGALSVPLLNLLAMPLLVVAGTLLALRLPPPASPVTRAGGGPAPGAGTPTSP